MQGVAKETSTQREGDSVVLRFLIKSADGSRTPVEMRGRKISGMVSPGDLVEISGRRVRDRDGVARPMRVRNVTTRSQVRIRQSRAKRALGSVARFASSVSAGVLAWALTSLVSIAGEPVADAPVPFDDGAVDFTILLPVAVGVLVALVVYLWLRRRARRN